MLLLTFFLLRHSSFRVCDMAAATQQHGHLACSVVAHGSPLFLGTSINRNLFGPVQGPKSQGSKSCFMLRKT